MQDNVDKVPCVKCGFANAGDHSYCANCGTAVTDEDRKVAQQVRVHMNTLLPNVLRDHVKGADVVEMQVTERILDRTSRWLKYAAFLVAIPAAVLGALGIKSYLDVSEAYKKISQETAAFEQRARDLQTQLNAREEAMRALKSKSDETLALIEGATSAVKDARNRATALSAEGTRLATAYQDLDKKLAQVRQLATTVTVLEKKATTLEARIPPPPVAELEKAVDTLARTVWGEARGAGEAAMEAVAAVVANRANSSAADRRGRWGSTVEDVCTKRYQFPSWNPSDPNHALMLRVDVSNPEFVKSLAIAKKAISGELIDRTGGAVNYHTAAVSPAWARGTEPTSKIGPFLFYRERSASAPVPQH